MALSPTAEADIHGSFQVFTPPLIKSSAAAAMRTFFFFILRFGVMWCPPAAPRCRDIWKGETRRMAVVAVVVCVCIIIHFDVNKSMPIFNETPQSVEKSSTLRHHPLSQPCRSHAITFFFLLAIHSFFLFKSSFRTCRFNLSFFFKGPLRPLLPIKARKKREGMGWAAKTRNGDRPWWRSASSRPHLHKIEQTTRLWIYMKVSAGAARPDHVVWSSLPYYYFWPSSSIIHNFFLLLFLKKKNYSTVIWLHVERHTQYPAA